MNKFVNQEQIDNDIDIQLCRDCYDDANMEIEHLDGRHDDRPKTDCKYCGAK